VANISMWLDGPGAAETAWTERARAQMAPHASPGVYVNFLGDEGEAEVRAAYRANYERLGAIKTRYDPDNLFHRNQNVRPA
jgi:FAD/FMN-containing dehydrogenase